jgi:hypothetical protein
MCGMNSTNALNAASAASASAALSVKICRQIIAEGGYFAEDAAAELDFLVKAEKAAQAAYTKLVITGKTFNSVLEVWQ